MANHYQTLGVSQNASTKEIKSAFRALAIQYHPDKNASPDATKKFIEIKRAYETLSHSTKRTLYDSVLNRQHQNPTYAYKKAQQSAKTSKRYHKRVIEDQLASDLIKMKTTYVIGIITVLCSLLFLTELAIGPEQVLDDRIELFKYMNYSNLVTESGQEIRNTYTPYETSNLRLGTPIKISYSRFTNRLMTFSPKNYSLRPYGIYRAKWFLIFVVIMNLSLIISYHTHLSWLKKSGWYWGASITSILGSCMYGVIYLIFSS